MTLLSQVIGSGCKNAAGVWVGDTNGLPQGGDNGVTEANCNGDETWLDYTCKDMATYWLLKQDFATDSQVCALSNITNIFDLTTCAAPVKTRSVTSVLHIKPPTQLSRTSPHHLFRSNDGSAKPPNLGPRIRAAAPSGGTTSTTTTKTATTICAPHGGTIAVLLTLSTNRRCVWY